MNADQITEIAKAVGADGGRETMPAVLAMYSEVIVTVARVAAELSTISGRFDEHSKIQSNDEAVIERLRKLVSESKENIDKAVAELIDLIRAEPQPREDIKIQRREVRPAQPSISTPRRQ